MKTFVGQQLNVRVATCVGHAQPSASVVLQLEVFILEALSVDGASAGSVSLGEITA